MMGDSENDNGAETNSTESIVNPNNLRILRSSRIYGRMEGGDEIILLTSFIDPTDIQVEFFQLINDIEIKWRSLAILNKIDIHGNCSLVFRTPAYKLSDVESQSQSSSVVAQDANNKTSNGNNSASKSHSRIKVYYRLCRPSTGDHSEKWVYFYCQDYLYDEYRILFGDRIVNDSRLITRLFATSKLNLNSSNNSFETKIGSNKRKIDQLVNDNEHEHDSSRDNLLPKVKIESNDTMDLDFKNNENDESTSKKLATKWLKKDIVERSWKDTMTRNEANSTGGTTSSKASALNADEAGDDEMNAEQLTKIIECVVNTPTSSIYTNDDDETSGGEQACAKSPLTAAVTRSKIEKKECETQTNLEEMLKLSGEEQKLGT